jgi:hypothetical protein
MSIEFIPFDSSRFIIIGMFSILALMFVILGIRVKLRGQKTPQTRYISRFFLYVGGSICINIIYSPFAVVLIQQLGSITVMLLVTMGVTNLMLFTLSVKYSEKELTPNKSIMIELIVFLVAIGYYFIPDGTSVSEIDYSPIWSAFFVIYSLSLTQFLMLIAITSGFSISKKMTNLKLKRRFGQFNTGLIFTSILLLSTSLGNGGILNSTVELILTLTIFPAAILIYLGVGRKLED